MKTSPVRNLLLSSALLFTASTASAASFGKDITFLKKHTEVIVLRDKAGSAQVALAPSRPRALAPAWQGRVMTSTAGGNSATGATGLVGSIANSSLLAKSNPTSTFLVAKIVSGSGRKAGSSSEFVFNTKSKLLLDFRRGAQRVSPIRRLYEPEAPPVCFGMLLGSNAIRVGH